MDCDSSAAWVAGIENVDHQAAVAAFLHSSNSYHHPMVLVPCHTVAVDDDAVAVVVEIQLGQFLPALLVVVAVVDNRVHWDLASPNIAEEDIPDLVVEAYSHPLN